MHSLYGGARATNTAGSSPRARFAPWAELSRRRVRGDPGPEKT